MYIVKRESEDQDKRYLLKQSLDWICWILGYTVHFGNEHDSRTFHALLYDKIYKLNPRMVVAGAGYKIPEIVHRLLEDGIELLFPYICPKTKDGFSGNMNSYMMNTTIVIYVGNHMY